MTTLAGKMASVLAPHLGTHSADAVAQYICAKYGIDEGANREKLEVLRDFLRRGLVTYVGAEKAQELAGDCIETSGGRTRGTVAQLTDDPSSHKVA
jgi:hypothetical protein